MNKRFVKKVLLSTVAFSFVLSKPLPASAIQTDPYKSTEYVEIEPSWHLNTVGRMATGANLYYNATGSVDRGFLPAGTEIRFLQQVGTRIRVEVVRSGLRGYVPIGSVFFPL